MPERKKIRYLQKIVSFCIAFTAAILVIALALANVAGSNEVIITKVIDATALVFGGELLLTVVVRLAGPVADKKGDKKEDEP